METEHLTSETQPSAESTPAVGGDEAGSQAPSSTEGGDNLTLAELNELLGKQYKDKATALKSLKDMNSMAGRAADQSGKKDVELAKRLEALEIENFYARNPEHEANREILEAFAVQHNISVKEAAELDVYKKFAKKGTSDQKRTVMDSKPRTQPVSSDRDKDFEEAKRTGEWGKFLVKYHAGGNN